MPSKPDQITAHQEVAIRAGIGAAGGLNRMARELGYRTAERVRQFYARGSGVPAEKCRAFVRAAQGAVTLLQVRPDLYAGLTVEELGYSPRAQRGGRSAS
jgi:DNA-binding transcriptional regulator YdaS (Cro superfamily)